MIYYLDLETTGLDPVKDRILEIALSRADERRPFEATPIFHAVLPLPTDRNLTPFIQEMHGSTGGSGLIAECMASQKNILAVESEIMALIPTGDKGATLGGASVHFDRSFLLVHMCSLARRFSHRLFDVRAVKLFCEYAGMPPLVSADAHRAVPDVAETVGQVEACYKFWGV